MPLARSHVRDAPGTLPAGVRPHTWGDTGRHRDGLPHLPLPISIGAGFFVNDLTTDELARAAAQLRPRGDDRG